jgi:hypothetical protein
MSVKKALTLFARFATLHGDNVKDGLIREQDQSRRFLGSIREQGMDFKSLENENMGGPL